MVQIIIFITFFSLALIGQTLSTKGDLGALAKISGPNNVTGSFRFRNQLDTDGVKVVISMSGLLQFNLSLGFSYNIYAKPISDGNCSSVFEHFHVSKIKPSCHSETPQWCQPGELALRHGNLTGTVNQFTQRFNDTAIYLDGDDSIIGKSIVIHAANLFRVACGNIEAWTPDRTI